MKNSLIGLGRIHVPDERDKQYLMLPPRRAEVLSQRTWTSLGVLDQGATPMCVAYAGTKYLTTSPISNKPPYTPPELYRRAQLVDGIVGPHEGTTTRALFQVLKAAGYVKEYRWAYDVETIVKQILTTGPVVVGTDWFRDMFTPNRWGYIEPDGVNDGGHEWLLIGASRTRVNPDRSIGAFRMINSWGSGWGENGRAWISFKDFGFLLDHNGDACVATEILV